MRPPSVAERSQHGGDIHPEPLDALRCTGTAKRGMLTAPLHAQFMALSERQLLHFLGQMPFSDSAELAGILGEPHATVHRALTGLLADRIVGRVSHGTTHLPSSQRYYLTAKGIGEAAETFGFDTPSDFVRAYPVSREWLALLIRRMDAVAAVYRLASSLARGPAPSVRTWSSTGGAASTP